MTWPNEKKTNKKRQTMLVKHYTEN